MRTGTVFNRGLEWKCDPVFDTHDGHYFIEACWTCPLTGKSATAGTFINPKSEGSFQVGCRIQLCIRDFVRGEPGAMV